MDKIDNNSISLESYMDDLISLILNSKEYQEYQASLISLQTEKELLERYADITQEYQEQKKYEKYIDISAIKEQLTGIKQEMQNNATVMEYYSKLNALNELLDIVTNEIFKDLIDPSLLQPYFK